VAVALTAAATYSVAGDALPKPVDDRRNDEEHAFPDHEVDHREIRPIH